MSDKPTTDRNRKGGGQDEGEPSTFAVVDRRPQFEESGASEPAPRYPSFVEELKARAEEAERRAREISAAYRRIDEERDAFRERLSRDLERRVDIARAEILRRIIPALDDLDRAIAAARATRDPAALLSGVTLTRERILQALAAEGVEEIRTEGRPFDPTVAEAVATEPTDDAASDNLVVEEMERGYTLRGALLRPARVKVARAKPSLSSARDDS
jgi:molecular chaperone GrpE